LVSGGDIDEFGLDPDFIDRVLAPLLRPLARQWFRLAVTGVDNVPDAGPALVVANHSGVLPLDALMTALALRDEHPAHRRLRMLGGDVLFRPPVVRELVRKAGATRACVDDADRLLAAGEVVGVWPEGYKGIGKSFRQRYRLQRFGRGGFATVAIRAAAPIVPCAIVGAEETYPMLANATAIARLLRLPYFPITPTFPWLGPLGLIPLPSKWLIEFGEPIPTAGYGVESADDPALVAELAGRPREAIQIALDRLRAQRGPAFG
jgi:1-acyl-sn-glycerol-3-phosphate acyltransferase